MNMSHRRMILGSCFALALAVSASPSLAQENSEAAPLDPREELTGPQSVVFQSGTGNGQVAVGTPDPLTGIARVETFVRPTLSCADIPAAIANLKSMNAGQDVVREEMNLVLGAGGLTVSPYPLRVVIPGKAKFIDKSLFDHALASYQQHHCYAGGQAGPAVIVIVDFSKKSNTPRLYRVDLRNGDGLQRPILVAHGIGSDSDRDGLADNFSNVNMSLMSSLGAVRGAEIYQGRSGRALRLDGLDPTNNLMRYRNIVVHSYRGASMRYFNASYQTSRNDTPGESEGCFVIEPENRDWLIDTLANGGFLYAGISDEREVQIAEANKAKMLPRVPYSDGEVIFASGTGSTTAAPVQPTTVPTPPVQSGEAIFAGGTGDPASPGGN